LPVNDDTPGQSGGRRDQVTAYLGLGSNLGDRAENLQRALELLGRTGDLARDRSGVEVAQVRNGIEVAQVSPVYETDPVGYLDQPPFLNLVAEIRTNLAPVPLLQACLRAERDLGRVRTVRWGPRSIDIDILLYGALTLREPDLEIPHPRLWERAFVLIPLLDLRPDLPGPDGRPARELPTASDSAGVRRWGSLG
jgi:2-amino-4-hydroxy-6-hydroxymethyldihydropteridine diphosphokinase